MSRNTVNHQPTPTSSIRRTNTFASGAASRNRTGDLRITRRIRAVHGRPAGQSIPACAASRSADVQNDPGPLLANPLARSVAAAPVFYGVGCAALGRPRRGRTPGATAGRVVPPRYTMRLDSVAQLASSSRSQFGTRTAATSACLIWAALSSRVRWRPPLSMAVVTHLVTRGRQGRYGRATWATAGSHSLGDRDLSRPYRPSCRRSRPTASTPGR